MAVRTITKTNELDGQQNPLVTPQGTYVQEIKQLFAGYRKLDPPVQRRLAVPLDVPRQLLLNAKAVGCCRMEAVADISIIAFFFLLRSCEYTAAPESNRRQTIPFQWKDVQLWENTSRLSMFLPYTELVKQCTAVTLCLLNQKLGRRGAPITHHELDDDHPAADVCPVKVVLRQLQNSRKHSKFQRHIISTYVTKKNELATISARTITAALKRCVKMLKLDEIGI